MHLIALVLAGVAAQAPADVSPPPPPALERPAAAVDSEVASSPAQATEAAAPRAPSPAPAPASVEKCSIAVLDFAATKAPVEAVKVFVDRLAAELEKTSGCRVLTAGDIRSMLEFEATKQALGCDAASAACLAELGGALGVSEVVTGDVVALGDETAVITARRVEISGSRVAGRANITAGSSPASLREAGPRVAAILLGAVDPGAPPAGGPPPAALAVGGAGLVVAGVAAGVLAFAETKLATPDSSGVEKGDAVLLSRGALVGAALGAVGLVVGGALWAVGGEQ